MDTNFKLNRKNYKKIKKEICENSAREVGYAMNVFSEIPSYTLVEAMMNIALNGYITEKKLLIRKRTIS